MKTVTSDFLPALVSILIAILFVNVLLIDYDYVFNQFDRKVIYFNTVASLTIIAASFALARRVIYLDKGDLFLLAFTFFISVNYFIKNGRYDNFFVSVILISILFILIKQFRLYFEVKKNLIFYLICIFLLTGLYESLLGIFQLFKLVNSPGQRIIGTFNNPGVFSIYVGASFIFSSGYYFHSQNISRFHYFLRQLCITNLLAGIIILPATKARAAWLGILISCIIIFYLLYRKRINPIIKKYKWSLVAILCIILLMSLSALYFYKKDSADGRIVIWKTGWLALKNNFFTGVGFDQFENRFPQYQATYFENNPKDGFLFSDNVIYAFNDFLHIAIENGAIGLILFLFFIVYSAVAVVRQKGLKGVSIAAAAAGVFVFVNILVSYPLEIVSIRFALFFFIVLLALSLKENPVIRIKRLPTLCVCILLTLGCILVIGKQKVIITAKQLLREAKDETTLENFAKANFYYESAIHLVPFEKRILMDHGLTFLKMNDFENAAKVFSEANEFFSDPYLCCNLALAYENLKNFSLAEHYFKMAIRMMPNRMYFKYQLAKMYINSGNYLAAKSTAVIIINMPVKIESMAIAQMKEEMKIFLNNSTLKNEIP